MLGSPKTDSVLKKFCFLFEPRGKLFRFEIVFAAPREAVFFVKFLGIIDIFVAVILLAVALKADLPLSMAITFSILLLIKGFIGITFATLIDAGAAIIILSSLFVSVPWWVCAIFIILIAQKGIVTLVSL
jgi:hypothetical protein